MIDPLPVDDEPEFEDVYRLHHRDVLRYAALMLRDPDEAADVTADTFARAWDAWQDGRGSPDRPLPWLFTIARRLVVDRARRRRLIRWLPIVAGSNVAHPDRADGGEFWIWLDGLARALPERQREVIFLRYRRDLSDEEIGEVMGLSASGVRSLLSRAIRALRDHPELLS